MRQMRERRPDLVLLDVMMPGALDGFGVLEAMQTLFGQNRPPVILATAVSDADRVRNAIHFGVVDYIVKPFKLRDVTARVEKVLLGQPNAARPTVAVSRQLVRAALLDRITELVAALEVRTALAVVRVTLDGFEEGTNGHGPSARAEFLAETERRVRSAIRPCDTVLPSDGGEFLVLLPGVGEAGATWTARKLLNVLGTINQGVLAPAKVAVHVGIALAASKDTDVAALVRQADTAVAQARQAGSGFAVFRAER
jgi:diguanylate cyclase (GGDEF)-like protein